jgi:5-methyltetrahydrofolate--homocysteine methyltransferase
VIKAIHAEYLDAGADIIETNTFSTQVISLADYNLEELAYELSYEGARIAREVADEYTKNTRKTTLCGRCCRANKPYSFLSPDVNDPGYRAVTFDDLADAYYDQVRGLVDGGSDLLIG